jgi:precorrin-2 dehydrogenase/sirohydrochlorin ferrochelatase
MGFIPIFLQVEGRPCLVVGGGQVARRKVETLLDAGAAVTVISPELTGALVRHAEEGRISIVRRTYRDGDMGGYHLVYAATVDRELQRRLFEEARRLNILINVADSPEFCSFIVPSVLRRGRLQVAISTSGASPAIARVLRERMEQWLGDELEALVEVMAGARDWLKRREPDASVRARKLGALAAAEDLSRVLRDGDIDGVERIAKEYLGPDVTLRDLLTDGRLSRLDPAAGKREC